MCLGTATCMLEPSGGDVGGEVALPERFTTSSTSSAGCALRFFVALGVAGKALNGLLVWCIAYVPVVARLSASRLAGVLARGALVEASTALACCAPLDLVALPGVLPGVESSALSLVSGVFLAFLGALAGVVVIFAGFRVAARREALLVCTACAMVWS
jgi:hypothetical protein